MNPESGPQQNEGGENQVSEELSPEQSLERIYGQLRSEFPDSASEKQLLPLEEDTKTALDSDFQFSVIERHFPADTKKRALLQMAGDFPSYPIDPDSPPEMLEIVAQNQSGLIHVAELVKAHPELEPEFYQYFNEFARAARRFIATEDKDQAIKFQEIFNQSIRILQLRGK